jgi:hypothetical protein
MHLAKHRTMLKHRIHQTLITDGHACPVSDLFGVRGRDLLERIAIPDPWANSAAPNWLPSSSPQKAEATWSMLTRRRPSAPPGATIRSPHRGCPQSNCATGAAPINLIIHKRRERKMSTTLHHNTRPAPP